MKLLQKLILVLPVLLWAASGSAQTSAAPALATDNPASQSSTAQTPAVQTPEAQPTTSTATLPDAPKPQATAEPRQKTAQEILDEEKKQKMMGIVPIYGMTNYKYAPALTSGQKFDLTFRTYMTVFPYLAAGFQAGLSQATNSFQGYGQGASGYGKRFGSALLDGANSAFFSNFLYPVIFKQDPRYFRLGEGTTKRRIWYAMKQEFITKKDSDRKPVFS